MKFDQQPSSVFNRWLQAMLMPLLAILARRTVGLCDVGANLFAQCGETVRINSHLHPRPYSAWSARHVGRKSDSAFRQRSVHTEEGAGKKPPAFPPYVVAILLLVSLAACERRTAPEGPVYADAPVKVETRAYRLAVHPLHNPVMLMQSYQPLAEYLNARIPEIRIEIEASRDYAEFERKLRAGAPELLLPNPWQTLEAMKQGYGVLAMAGDAADFKGLFIVRRDSPIRDIDDLRGRAVAYPSPTALAACIMPQWFLHTRGLDVNEDIENRYVGSQESAIMNAYLGQTAVGVTWPPPWRAFVKANPEQAAELKVIWETPPLLNNSVMARQDVPQRVRTRIAELLSGLHATPEGRAILAGMQTARFHAANDADYAGVADFVAGFEAEVRPVDIP